MSRNAAVHSKQKAQEGKEWLCPNFGHEDSSGPKSGVNKSAREQIGRQNLSQKVPSKKGSLGVIFSPRNYRENAHSKSTNFEGRHSGGHLLGRPLCLLPTKGIKHRFPHELCGKIRDCSWPPSPSCNHLKIRQFWKRLPEHVLEIE